MQYVKIALAGDLGSGKSTVGKILAKMFAAECYSTGTIQRQIAEEMGMTTLELNKYSESHPEIDFKIDDGLRALNDVNKNLIIDSRMAWHFIPAAFAVYLQVEPLLAAKRILADGRMVEKFASVEEAMQSILHRRESEVLRYKTLYQVDIQNLKNYDCVIDTSYCTPEAVAERIQMELKAWQNR